MRSWREIQAVRDRERAAEKKATFRVMRDLMRVGFEPVPNRDGTPDARHVSAAEFAELVKRRKKFYLR